MTKINPLNGRTIVWALAEDATHGGPSVPTWAEHAVAAMRRAGATVDTVAIQKSGSDVAIETGALAAADVVLATTISIGTRLAEAGVERFRLWTFLQGGPGRPLRITEESEPGLRHAVEVSRKVLVFDEDARSTVESALWGAAAQVILFPDATEAGQTGFRSSRTGTPALVVHLGLTGTLGLEAINRHAEQLRPQRETRPLFLIGSPELQTELRTHPVYRQFAAVPGARGVSPDDASLEEALEGFRPFGFVPRPTSGHSHRTAAARSWFESRGIELWAEHGALPALPRHEHVLRWSGETLTADLEAVRRSAIAGDLPEPPAEIHDLEGELGDVMGPYLADYETVPRRIAPDGALAARTRVLLVGADFKFAGDLIEAMAQREDLEVKVDRWQTNGGPVPEDDGGLLAWADVIMCEFASRNAVWYSHRVRTDQRLLLHLHGYELRQPLIHDIKIEAVESVVFASEFYREKALKETGWPRDKTSVIANPVQAADLARIKLPDARFHLGMAGYVPELKRPDRALDVLQRLLDEDDRYVLHLRGHSPWNYNFVWGRPLRRDAYLAFYERLRRDQRLRNAVVFDSFGPDMGTWFRGIGWVLSPSTRETFHLAAVEGMASGAVPVVWRREGSEEIFPDRWNVDSSDDAARLILEANANPATMGNHSAEAASWAGRYDARRITGQWLELLVHGPTSQGEATPPTRHQPVAAAERSAGEADRWEEARVLAATGRLALAQGLIDSDSTPPWNRSLEQRRLTGEIIGVQGLRQRVHRLHGVQKHPPLRKDLQSVLLVCGPGKSSDDVTGNVPPGPLDIIILREAWDNADAVFDQWVDLICRRALEGAAGVLYGVGDEITGLACTVAASRLGIKAVWDVTSDTTVSERILTAAADPDRSTDRGVIALMAARHADRTASAPLAHVDTRAPIEDRVQRPRLSRVPRIGVIGDDVDLRDMDRSLEDVRLGRGSWQQLISQGLDGLVISGAAARLADWNEAVSGPNSVMDLVITEARRYNIPIGLLDPVSEAMDPVLTYARRVDAVVAPGAEDVARLHDRRIVATQVATALPAVQPSEKSSGPTSTLLSRGEQLELLFRMLRINSVDVG
ncbi:glycosyltransferase family 4 protein [Cellulosimicrobium funkei]|nr:glycosyltransferase family 4 protein [Cellulosimicrobium funkei]